MEQGKKTYIVPEIELIRLDNQISLALESDPSGGPGETMINSDVYRNDPFKTNVG